MLLTARRAAWRAEALGQKILFRIQAADGQVPHTGVLVTTLFQSDPPCSTKVLLACAGEQRTRVEYLSEPMRGLVVLEERGRTWRVDPGQGLILVENPLALASGRQRRLALLLSNYLPRYLGRGRVAHRPTLRLALISRRTGWIARRLWADEPTGLPLRWDEYHPNGHLVMSTAYCQVRFGPPDLPLISPQTLPQAVQVVIHGAQPMAEPDLSRWLGIPLAHPQYLPEGFVYEGSFLGECPQQGRQPVACLRYTDGLRTISVFQSCRMRTHVGEPEGVPLASGGMVRIHRGGATFVFVGDASEEELARMAQSLP